MYVECQRARIEEILDACRSQSAPPILHSPLKRKRWSQEQMRAAINAVKKGMSMNRAAKEHGVPKSTLHDRVHGNVIHGTNPQECTKF